MFHLLQALFDWGTRPTVLSALLSLSLLSLLASVVGVPWYLRRMPADYFSHHEQRRAGSSSRAPAGPVAPWHAALTVLKNMVGGVLVLAGIAMLILPGQGLATILVGMLMMDFPRKKSLQRRILSVRPVLRAVNSLRKRAGQPPLMLTAELPTPPDLEPHSHPSSAR